MTKKITKENALDEMNRLARKFIKKCPKAEGKVPKTYEELKLQCCKGCKTTYRLEKLYEQFVNRVVYDSKKDPHKVSEYCAGEKCDFVRVTIKDIIKHTGKDSKEKYILKQE